MISIDNVRISITLKKSLHALLTHIAEEQKIPVSKVASLLLMVGLHNYLTDTKEEKENVEC